MFDIIKKLFRKNHIPKFSGLLPDLPDARDIPLSSIQERIDIPEEFKRDLSFIPIDAQGKHPACVGYAASKVKEGQELDEHQQFIDISPRFIYAMCKKIDGYSGGGTYTRVAMKILKNYGACLEKGFPSNTSLSKDEFKNWELIPEPAYIEAKKYKIKTYATVDKDWESLKQAIYQNKIVLGGQTGSRNGWSQLPLRPPQEGEKLFGHAIAYYGYDKNYIYFINSWSQNYGENGIGYFGRDMLPYLHSTWTAVDIINNNNMDKLQIIGDKSSGKQFLKGEDGKLRHIFNEIILEDLNNAGIIDKNNIEWVDSIGGYEIVEPWAVIRNQK